MLRKLYKYDFLCSSRKNVPLYIIYIVMTIAVKIIDESLVDINDINYGRTIIAIFISTIAIAQIVLTLMIFFVGFFGAIGRFRKNLFSDEGYLINTLPVKASQHIWSKLLNAFSWAGISLVVLLIANWIMVGGGSVYNFFEDIYVTLRITVKEIIQSNEPGSILLLIILVVNPIINLSCLGMLSMFYAAIENTFTVLKKKHVMVLTSVVIVSLFFTGSYTVFYVLLKVIYDIQMTAIQTANLIFGTSLAVSAVLFVLSFLGTKYLMEKKLNLQ